MPRPVPHDRAAAQGRQCRQAVRRLRCAGRHQSRRRPRRAARPDRTERLGQEHAGELPVRHAAQRNRQRQFRGPRARRPARPPAHPPRHGAQFPVAAPVCKSDGCRQSARAAALYGQGALGHCALGRRPRRALPRPARARRAGTQGEETAARPDAGGNAQARTCARHGLRSQAADRGRGDGRPLAVGGQRHCRALGPHERARRDHRADRAYHERGDEFLAAAGRARIGAQDRRRQTRRGDPRSRGGEGISWPIP